MNMLYSPINKASPKKDGDAKFPEDTIFRPISFPSFEKVKKYIQARYQVGDDDDLGDCEECQREIYKATLKLMGIEVEK